MVDFFSEDFWMGSRPEWQNAQYNYQGNQASMSPEELANMNKNLGYNLSFGMRDPYKIGSNADYRSGLDYLQNFQASAGGLGAGESAAERAGRYRLAAGTGQAQRAAAAQFARPGVNAAIASRNAGNMYGQMQGQAANNAAQLQAQLEFQQQQADLNRQMQAQGLTLQARQGALSGSLAGSAQDQAERMAAKQAYLNWITNQSNLAAQENMQRNQFGQQLAIENAKGQFQAATAPRQGGMFGEGGFVKGVAAPIAGAIASYYTGGLSNLATGLINNAGRGGGGGGGYGGDWGGGGYTTGGWGGGFSEQGRNWGNPQFDNGMLVSGNPYIGYGL